MENNKKQTEATTASTVNAHVIGSGIIAEFMGVAVKDGKIVEETNLFGSGSTILRPMMYHESWDEFMPVFLKINKAMSSMSIARYNRTQIDIMYNIYCCLQSEIIDVDINKAFESAVEFIKEWQRIKKGAPDL